MPSSSSFALWRSISIPAHMPSSAVALTTALHAGASSTATTSLPGASTTIHFTVKQVPFFAPTLLSPQFVVDSDSSR
ncbi:unnamed protein product [Protopolystoma xenopodis]|uniref:Uncharacterized protein n=1 Tax=Protopolystoma xenopodis TaxID=117903 RepID=A0A448XSR7_9PLAT|nr:unnamed protein product [Protopolystoma xenopodis]